MTYQDSEAGIASGKPIELYDFAFGVDHWRYTSASETVTYMNHDYEPVLIQRSDLEQSDNAFKNELSITVGRDNEFAQQFIAAPLDGIVTLTVYRGHGSDYVTFWMGVMSSISFNSDEVKITASPKTTSMLRTGLRRKYQKLCNYPLYGSGCRVNNELFKVTSTIATISGLTITSAIFATKADGWFTAGMIKIGDKKRLITSHTGSTITISHSLIGVVAGNSFTAYAGCDHLMATCRTKFSNLDNYGGQPWIPTKNPFTGDGITTQPQANAMPTQNDSMIVA
jgi:uncharacterized phage protein (TIGR02218 family)